MINKPAIKSFFKNFFVFEKDYVNIFGVIHDLRYFIKQGHILSHLKDRLKFRIFPKIYVTPEFPSHIDIEVASACQMRCPMCFTTYMDDSLKGIMKFDLYKKIIEECAARGVYSVKLSWRGEPLLNTNIVDMVSLAKKLGIKEVGFLTNAELLTNKISRSLVDAGLDWISISADGVGEVYNKIRAPAIFEETVSKVSSLKSYRDSKGVKYPLIRVQTILSAVSDTQDYKKFVKSWGNLADRINLISDHIRSYDNFTKRDFDPFYKCPTPWQRVNIAYTGKVHQCTADYTATNILGDINEQTIYDVWHGPGFKKLRAVFMHGNYLEEFKACYFCSYGLKRSSIKMHNINTHKFDSAEMVVQNKKVIRIVPEDKLTPRIKKSRENSGEKL
ncbi:radical SAM protein [Polynucleobacter sp. AP-Ainpum-60-G11]|uniref:radical SAM protein n=1 Tax=Polynucleobacter sp. AP-Ainpum-60-G11 TaxID=2576926 RepID=UPI001BFD5CA3|nr:radical SAM protein [Polynucleobacter sp. AP-Ainpum-60-G11]QWE27008.1 SPASM domain-containing protein [Polynucleobacter sp. AP-Ainpum-60-G11]